METTAGPNALDFLQFCGRGLHFGQQNNPPPFRATGKAGVVESNRKGLSEKRGPSFLAANADPGRGMHVLGDRKSVV